MVGNGDGSRISSIVRFKDSSVSIWEEEGVSIKAKLNEINLFSPRPDYLTCSKLFPPVTVDVCRWTIRGFS